MYSSAEIGPGPEWISLDTTHCVRTSTSPVTWPQVLSGLYLACTGQIGMQLELPSQRRPSCGAPCAPTGW